jgi:hypothetical protein
MNSSLKLQQLRQYQTNTSVKKSVLFSPLLCHFLTDRAHLFSISEAEFLRRLLSEALVQHMQHGLYRLPNELRTFSQKPRPRPADAQQVGNTEARQVTVHTH